MSARPIAHGGRIFWLWSGDDAASRVFDPKTGRWSPLAEPFPGNVRDGAAIVSTGTALIVSCGIERPATTHYGEKATSTGARFERGKWAPLPTSRALTQRSHATAVWTGRELLIWSGHLKHKRLASGAAFDPATSTWRKLPARATMEDPDGVVWTGRELWMWNYDGGGGTVVRQGHAYDPDKDEWRELAILPETSNHDHATLKCGDGAIHVCREGMLGTDKQTCTTWRYEPRADVWEPSAPPPRVPGGSPRLVDCDGRIVLGLHESLFEYLPERDAWAELPAPKVGVDPHLVWLNGMLHAIGDETRALELPKKPKVRAAEAAPVVIASAAAPKRATGAPVTALSFEGDKLIADRAVTTKHAVRHRDAVIVSGDGTIARLEKGKVVRSAKAPGETLHVGFFGGVVTRAVLGPDRGATYRSRPRDVLEVRDAKSLEIRYEISTSNLRGTLCAAPTATTIWVGGSMRLQRWPIGKKKAAGFINASAALGKLTTSEDGNWLLAAREEGGVDLYDLRLEKCLVRFDAEPTTAVAINADGSRIAFGTNDGAIYEIDPARLGITCSGAVVQPPASEIVDEPPPSYVDAAPRAEPDGEKAYDGWSRWKIPGQKKRFIELPEQALEVAVLRNDDVAVRHRKALVILSPSGTQRRWVGHGGDLEAMRPADDGQSITVWDDQGIARTWRLTAP